MASLKSLASDTVVYGATTILSRLLNWLMMPYYIHTISQSEFGMVTIVYSYIALLLVVVTLGFETGYFRFVSDSNKSSILGSLSSSVLGFGVFLTLLFAAFPSFFCSLFEIGTGSVVTLIIMSLIVVVDSYNAIFFADLRFSRRSMLYAVLRLVQVLITVLLNVFFLNWFRHQPMAASGVFASFSSVDYVLLANLVGSLSSTLYFIPTIAKVFSRIDVGLLRSVLVYSLPLVGMGFFGSANQNIEKILIRHLDVSADPLAQLGIYGASYKIGILMAIFTQSFRMAFEPFFFRENKSGDKRDINAVVLKYFVYFGLLIFAGVILFRPLLWISGIIPANYVEGFRILPLVLIGQLFFGVYYSLSMWYKVIDKTYFGIIMSFVGLCVNTALNFLLIPRIGYLGAAVATFSGYLVMMILSFVLGQHYYPVNYPFADLIKTSLSVLALVFLGSYLMGDCSSWLWVPVSLVSFALVVFLFAYKERSLVGRILHRR